MAIPRYTTDEAVFRPLMERIAGHLLTAGEAAKHLRYSPNHLSNLRKAGKGWPWLVLPTGAIRYRASDVLLGELAAEHGPLTVDRVVLAVTACQSVPVEHRMTIIDHLRRAFAETDAWGRPLAVPEEPAVPAPRQNLAPRGALGRPAKSK